jgi:hypothetical protein
MKLQKKKVIGRKYSAKEVNQARVMHGEGKSMNATKPEGKWRNY